MYSPLKMILFEIRSNSKFGHFFQYIWSKLVFNFTNYYVNEINYSISYDVDCMGQSKY